MILVLDGSNCKEGCKVIQIIGAGLGGAYLAILLAREGYLVRLFEKRKDLRAYQLKPGKSVNMGLSVRGLNALKAIGLHEKFMSFSIPMYGRMIHDQKGVQRYQSYSNSTQDAIYAFRRNDLNSLLLDEIEKYVEEEVQMVIASIPYTFFSDDKKKQIIQDAYDKLEDGCFYSQILLSKYNYKTFQEIFDESEVLKIPNMRLEYIYHCKKVVGE